MSDKKYLCMQRSQPGGSSTPPSPAQMQEMYARFQAWMTKFQGNIVDLGGRLGEGKVVTATDTMDGPYAESKAEIGGFMIIAAKSLHEAIMVARECPGVVLPGSSVEVREIHTP